MKKFYVALLLMMVTMSSFAQSVVGSFVPLAREGKATVEIDFSDAIIHNMSEKDFQEFEVDWNKDKMSVAGTIFSNIQDKLDNYAVFSKTMQFPYKLLVKVVRITVNGDFYCNVYLYDENQKELARMERVYGNGGRWGTKLNLIKDGAEDVGEAIGKKIRRDIRKSLVRMPQSDSYRQQY